MLDAREAAESVKLERGARSGRRNARTGGRTRAAASRGLHFSRVFSPAGVDPFDTVEWDRRKATIADEKGEELCYQIVGVDETDFARGRISWVSPLAKALWVRVRMLAIKGVGMGFSSGVEQPDDATGWVWPAMGVLLVAFPDCAQGCALRPALCATG